MSGSAGVVEGGKDTGRTLLLNEVADDFVVEVVNGSPLLQSEGKMSEEGRKRKGRRRDEL